MFKNNNLNFDNIKPSNQSFYAKKIRFRDRNDLILNAEKERGINFSKKSNFFIFLLTVSFGIPVSFIIETNFIDGLWIKL